MLTGIFSVVINMSITASIIAIVIMGVRFAAKNKLPRLFVYVLWLTVLIRIFIPFSFSSSFSLLNLVTITTSTRAVQTSENTGVVEYFAEQNRKTYSVKQTEEASNLDNSTQYENKDKTSNKLAQANLPVQYSTEETNTVKSVLAVIWSIGSLMFFTYSIAAYTRTRKNLSTAVKYKDNGLLAGCSQKLKLKRKISVYTSERINTPVLCGLIKPRIIIPTLIAENFNDIELENIIYHELVHIKRFDYLINIIAVIGLCIHWFNPIIWISYVLSRKDMEMSCDERVMQFLDSDTRKVYASSLLNLAVKQNNLLNGGLLAFGEKNIKTRIKGIMNYKKPEFWGVAVSIIAVAVLGTVMVSNPSIKDSNKLKENFLSLKGNAPTKKWINYENLPKYLVGSVIAAQDKNFRRHNGVDWMRTMKLAAGTIFSSGKTSNNSSSTITQQVIKQITDKQTISLKGKKEEIDNAIALEKVVSKEEIAETYLNTVYLGNGTYGVEAASDFYFAKSVDELTLAECVALAAMIDTPTYYDIVRYPDKNKSKRELILEEMLNLNIITKEEMKQALSEDVIINSSNEKDSIENQDTVSTLENTTEVLGQWNLNFSFNWHIKELPEEDIVKIKNLMTNAIKVYISEEPDIELIRKTFINTNIEMDYRFPQEALDNILLEAEHDSYWREMQRETIRHLDDEVNIDCYVSKNLDSAHVSIQEFYYRRPHEIVKVDGNWFITGFSTWSGTEEAYNAKMEAEIFWKHIITGSMEREMRQKKYDKKQIDIVHYLADKTYFKLGEVELWQTSDPHRAWSVNGVSYIKVKLELQLTHDGQVKKYHMLLRRDQVSEKWEFDSIGYLSPYLWPKIPDEQ